MHVHPQTLQQPTCRQQRDRCGAARLKACRSVKGEPQHATAAAVLPRLIVHIGHLELLCVHRAKE